MLWIEFDHDGGGTIDQSEFTRAGGLRDAILANVGHETTGRQQGAPNLSVTSVPDPAGAAVPMEPHKSLHVPTFSDQSGPTTRAQIILDSFEISPDGRSPRGPI